MQAALQPYVDGAIAKTVRLGPAAARESVAETLQSAYDMGLKGCTVFREAARAGVIKQPYLTDAEREASMSRHCCDLGRESD